MIQLEGLFNLIAMQVFVCHDREPDDECRGKGGAVFSNMCAFV